MDLPEDAREQWLEDLSEPFPGAKAMLRKMLKGDVSSEGEGVLDTLLKVPLSEDASGTTADTGPFKPNAQIGNYRLERLLGHGGMGSVWLAEQTAPVHRFVALKLIRAGMVDESVIKRFHSERQSLAIMDHPFIAKVFDAGTTPQGQPYLVMEYVPGLALTEYCDGKRLKIRDRIELFIQACEGVQHAHQKAIIHRDLKPANILVVEVDGKPVPRIIDFGLAKAAAPQLTGETLYTQFGHFLGTPGYMSPEQVDPTVHDIDTRTDVYSLGVVLYVLLTGLQPFETKRRERPSIEEWLRQLREDEPPRLSTRVGADRETANARASARGAELKQLAQQLHGDLEWIALKALERDRDRRYGTPSELAADLRRYLNDEPVLARPASAAYQLQKFVRRHRLGMTVAGVLMLTLANGLAATTYEARIASAERDAAAQSQLRSLTQTAAARLRDFDVAGAMGIILEVLPHRGATRPYTPEALSVFHEAHAADAQIMALTGHTERVWFASFSPDSRRIATASLDGTARIWDASTGTEIARFSGHTGRVFSASFSPDGQRVLTSSSDNTARIWDAETGRELTIFSGHSRQVMSAAFSPDGQRVATASTDKTARIWDAVSGRQIMVLGDQPGRFTTVAFSPDGRRVATGADDNTARIWDLATGRQIMQLNGHTDRIWRVGFSPDGRRVVTASQDKSARIWDVATGNEIVRLTGHADRVNSASFSPDGQRVVTASDDKTVRIWDAATAQQIMLLSGHTDRVWSAAFSPDNRRVVSTSTDKTARVWDVSIAQQIALLSGHTKRIWSAAYSLDGSRAVTASYDKTARIWDIATGKEIVQLIGHGDPVNTGAFSPDAKRVVTASDDKTARIWDAVTGQQLVLLSGHTDAVTSAFFSPDGARIVTAAHDKTARIWDSQTGRMIQVLAGHTDWVQSAVFSPDGAHVVTSSTDKTARVWDAATGQEIMVLSGHTRMLPSAEFSSDGARIVTASEDTTARIWDAATGQPIVTLSGHGGPVNFAAFSRDGRFVVTASDDKTARLWDSGTGRQVALLAGHTGAVESAGILARWPASPHCLGGCNRSHLGREFGRPRGADCIGGGRAV